MANLSDVLTQIRTKESGSAAGNYTLTPQQNYAYPSSHASGAYQFEPATWQSLTQRSGIGTQYSQAYQAPPNVQDAVAAYALEQNPNPNSTSLWHNANYTYPQVTNYDVSSAGLASGSQIAQGDTTNQGFGSNGSDPFTVTPGTSSGCPSGYQATGSGDCTPVTTGTGTGTTYGGNSSNTAGNAQTAAGAAGAAVGYLPPASTGGPQYTGLAAGTVSTISGWVSGIETAVGNAWKAVWAATFGTIEDYAVRAALMLLALTLLFIALWRITDPDGTRTAALAKSVAAV